MTRRVMTCRSVLSALLLFCTLALFAQQKSFQHEMRFAQYLQDKELFREARYIAGRIDTTQLNTAQKDSVFYFSGWSAYNAKQLDTAVSSLLRVSPGFPLYHKSRFFAAYCLTFLSRQKEAAGILTDQTLSDSTEGEMRQLQLAGMALLRRDYGRFEQYRQGFTYSSYVMEKEQRNMGTYYTGLRSYKRKSPFLAGLYSAVLPGAGKFYAGKKRQGIAAFLPVMSLAAVTYEAYRKGGVRSARFIGFGSLFSLFYVGNIWGSVLSVRIKEKEFYRAYDNKILFDLHIPLRNLYN